MSTLADLFADAVFAINDLVDLLDDRFAQVTDAEHLWTPTQIADTTRLLAEIRDAARSFRTRLDTVGRP